MKQLKPQPTDQVQMTIRVPRAVRDQLKRRSIDEWRPIQDIVVEAVLRDRQRSTSQHKNPALFDAKFMIHLRKRGRLERADYYDA